MPAIHIGDIQIPVQMVQQTTPSLKIMDATGTVYYVDAMAGACPDSVKVSDGTNVYSVGTQYLYYESDSVNSCDTISLPPGCYSVQVRGGRGGAGGRGAGGIDANGDAHDCGAGGGGNAGDMSNALGGYADSGLGNGFFLCGAGGDGTGTGGGDGGAAHRMLSERSGGDGGATLSFSCGGQMLYSYGGGGGGGVQASSNVPYRDVNGGVGGTGSTGASDTSFVRIYKFGNV